MTILERSIALYRRGGVFRTAVRKAVKVHHRLVPAERGPCPFTGTGIACSAAGLAEASANGWAALPGICARIAACGYDVGKHSAPGFCASAALGEFGPGDHRCGQNG